MGHKIKELGRISLLYLGRAQICQLLTRYMCVYTGENRYINWNEYTMLDKVDDNAGKRLTLFTSFYVGGTVLHYL